jgi:hypothetical protein
MIFNTTNRDQIIDAYRLFQEMDTFVDTGKYNTLLDYFVACNKESNGWVAEKIAPLLGVETDKAMESLIYVPWMSEPPSVESFCYCCSDPQVVWNTFISQ